MEDIIKKVQKFVKDNNYIPVQNSLRELAVNIILHWEGHAEDEEDLPEKERLPVDLDFYLETFVRPDFASYDHLV